MGALAPGGVVAAQALDDIGPGLLNDVDIGKENNQDDDANRDKDNRCKRHRMVPPSQGSGGGAPAEKFNGFIIARFFRFFHRDF